MAERLRAEPRPEIHQPVLCLAVDAPISLALEEVDAGADEPEGDHRAPKLRTHGEALDFGEIGEEPRAQASDRLVANEADEMCGDEVVPIELFLVRAGLLREINRRADRGDDHEISQIPGDPDRRGSV
jgi:hypothetical protein